MNKKQVVDIVNIKFNLSLKLIDELFYEIWELKRVWKTQVEIAEMIWILPCDLSKFIKPDISFIEWISNKRMAKWLSNLQNNK